MCPQAATQTLTAAQVNALNTTAITLVPPPDAGYIVVPYLVEVYLPSGTAFADLASGEDLRLHYGTASNPTFLTIETAGLLDGTTAQSRRIIGVQATLAGTSTFTQLAQPIVLSNSGATTLGRDGLQIRVFYHIIDSLSVV